MSIGIGLICNNGIILASDSRTEEPEGTIKRFDLPKITAFACGNISCGIVQAGRTGFASRCVEEIKMRALGMPPKDVPAFRNLIRDAVKETRIHSIAVSPSLDAESRDLHARFSLVIALCGPTSHLFTIDSSTTYDRPETSGTAFIGTGAELASYILHGLDFGEVPMSSGAVAAIHAIQGINLRDSECEGPISIWKIAAPPRGPSNTDKELVAELADDCARFEHESRSEWLNSMAEWMLAKGAVFQS